MKRPKRAAKRVKRTATKKTGGAIKSRFRLDSYVAGIKNQKVKENVENALFNPKSEERISAIKTLGRLGSKEAIPALEFALFDYRRPVRRAASNVLAWFIGLQGVANSIIKKYPRSSLGRVPAEFFKQYKISGKELAGLRLRLSPTVSELSGLRRRHGKPAFYHRGLPVFLVEIAMEKRGERVLGYHLNGAIILEKNTKKLPAQFRRVVAEHEFGEIFSHEVGTALEMRWLKKHGLLREALKEFSYSGKELSEIIGKSPKRFAEFRKYLK